MRSSSTLFRTRLLAIALAGFWLTGETVPAMAVERSRSMLEPSVLNEPLQPQPPTYNPLSGPAYPVMQDSYFTDDFGNILMTVNVLGEVNRPGQVIVRESVDFSTILALTGGTRSSANLGRVVVARREPDSNGKQAYLIDLKQYYKHGDRSMFIALKPNDTIIIPEKGMTLEKLSRIAGITLAGFDIYSILHNHN